VTRQPAIPALLLLTAFGCDRDSAEPTPTADRSAWHDFRSEDARFRIRFPAPPVVQVKALGSGAGAVGGGGLRAMHFSVEDSAGALYAVRFVEVPGLPPAAQIEAGFKAVRDRIAAEYGPRLEQFTERQIRLFGQPGREWKVRAKAAGAEPAIAKVTRMYVFEGRTYQLDYVRRDGEPNPGDVRAFFDSFSVPEARLEGWR
jgi:hypothetical protein